MWNLLVFLIIDRSLILMCFLFNLFFVFFKERTKNKQEKCYEFMAVDTINYNQFIQTTHSGVYIPTEFL